MKPDLVIYHGPECYDGFTAAWLLHDRFPDAEYLPANYGRTGPPDVTGRKVMVVDFSWPREDMIRMAEQAESILVLDHHKTAEEALSGLDFAVFDMDRSGCRMVWDHYGQGTEPTWLVLAVEDRDLWRMKLPHTQAIHAYYTSVPMTFEEWDKLNSMGRDNCVKLGNAIRQSIDRYCEKVSKERELYHSDEFGVVQVVNAPYLNASELADHMLKTGNTPWTSAWFRRADGRYQYSLRSASHFDVSRIAKAYGGGGHKNSAGFDSDQLPCQLWTRVE